MLKRVKNERLDFRQTLRLFFHPVIRMNPAVVDQLSVLSDATRVRMLSVLEGRELTVSEICDVIQLPQSTICRHMKTLLDGDWVASRRDGTRRLYTLPLDDVDTSIGRLALLLLLAGQPGGQYGVKDSATDGALPPLPATPAPSGG